MFLFHLTNALWIIWCFSGCNSSRNIALHQTTQSSEVLHGFKSRWGPNRTVDGNTNQNVYCDSCLHTQQQRGRPAFLKISFQNLSSVNRVEIFYRRPFVSNCSNITVNNTIQNDRFKAYKILLDNKTCYNDTSEPYPALYQNNSCHGTGNYLTIVQNRNTTTYGPILEICEVKVHGCPTSTYGNNCSQNCSVNCLNETCDPDTGVCWNGCKSGWIGDECKEKCPQQTFGMNCTGICRCYNSNNCHHINGSCPNGLCDSGWRGESCQEACHAYYYGYNCSQRCHDCKDNVTCHHVNGTCLDGCMDGYTSHKCDRECPVGFYGPGCSLKCVNCFKDSCRNTDGKCQQGCDKGYQGTYCRTACENGTYSYNCNTTCGNCRNSAICDRESGNCPGNDCEDGFKGPNCKDECGTGEYGQNCREKCGSCKDEVTCNSVNGICTNGCKDGYLWDDCKRECSTGYYGFNCSLSCTGNCLETCNHVNGLCLKGCKEGYEGKLCMEETSNSTGIVAGVTGAVIAFVIIIIVTIFVKRRRNKKHREGTSNRYLNSDDTNAYTNQYDSPNKKNFSNIIGKDRTLDDADDSGTLVDEESGMDGETYVNVASVTLGNTDMKVDQLRDRIPEKKAQGILGSEYMQLIRGAVHPHEIGKDPKNKNKNRFLTTFPYDHSLVSLSNGNYINANYIDDVEVKNTYIAAQGPKKNTLEDFWRMIWENGSSKIVMLANLVELGKNKCEQYWPNEKQEKINVGTYDIIMQNEKLYGAYNVRELLLKYKETREQRKVVQFHFTTWPDHGTADAIQLAIFQHVIDCEATQSTGPMVVHCSAGIGRTGTYIALDAMTKWIRNHSKVDVYSFVSSMRNNRMNMIQTVEQYIVLHEAMIEAQLMTNSAIKREDYGNVWRNISKSDFPKNEGRCRKEFQKLRLALSSVDDDSINEALSNQNKSKNRDQHIIPIRIYRPFLSSNLVKRSNYVNAVVLPSMKANVGMIATQYPTADTVQDFYSLIYDHDSPTIVILEPNEENVPLLPENKQTSVYGVVNVSYKHGDSGKDFNEGKLQLRKKDDNETKQVDVIECTSWPWRQSMPSSPFVVLTLIQRLLQTSHGDMQSSYPITIVCFNGATKCGLFCSLFNIIESLSDSGEVDILRHVRQLQIRRPEFISESAQYEFLYDAVNDHLEQANIYANV